MTGESHEKLEPTSGGLGIGQRVLRRFLVKMTRASLAAGTIKIDDKSALIVVDVQNCFLPGGSLAVKDGEQVIPVINRIAKKLRQCGDDAGLAHAGPRLVRFRPCRQEAVRRDQAALRRSGAVAGPLRTGHRRRRYREGHRDPAGRACDPQGLSQGHGQLLGVPRGRSRDADRLGRLSQAARPAKRCSSPGSPPTFASPGPPWTRGVSGSPPTSSRTRAAASISRVRLRPHGPPWRRRASRGSSRKIWPCAVRPDECGLRAGPYKINRLRSAFLARSATRLLT